MLDELYLRTEMPEIPWDEPVLISVLVEMSRSGVLERWACRYCIAMHGLKAQEIIQERAPEYVYFDRAQALAHIENTHHE